MWSFAKNDNKLHAAANMMHTAAFDLRFWFPNSGVFVAPQGGGPGNTPPTMAHHLPVANHNTEAGCARAGDDHAKAYSN